MKFNNIFKIFLITILLSNPAIAKIETKSQADKFLNNYCIEIVNSIETLYEDQKNLISKNEWKGFFEKGTLITTLADVYSKLCK